MKATVLVAAAMGLMARGEMLEAQRMFAFIGADQPRREQLSQRQKRRNRRRAWAAGDKRAFAA